MPNDESDLFISRENGIRLEYLTSELSKHIDIGEIPVEDALKQGFANLDDALGSYKYDATFFQIDCADENAIEGRINDFLRRIKSLLSESNEAILRNGEGFGGRHEPRTGQRSSNLELGDQAPFEPILHEMLRRIAKRLSGVLTLVTEESHIDLSYRNTYYHHYSNQFFDVPRRSLRVNFIYGKFELVDIAQKPGGRDVGPIRELYDCDSMVDNRFPLPEGRCFFIGSCVIDPVKRGVIGRTLIDPTFLIDRPAFIRCSTFDTTVFGRRLSVDAFPFRMQDGEIMRCAETSLLNLFCYYSNEYNDYGTVLPNDIIQAERQFAHERVTPGRGIDYYTFTRLLAHFRFFPRIYGLKEMKHATFSGRQGRDTFHRLLHWYICSGIPVAVNANPDGSASGGHSVICIGYSQLDETARTITKQALTKGWFEGCIYRSRPEDSEIWKKRVELWKGSFRIENRTDSSGLSRTALSGRAAGEAGSGDSDGKIGVEVTRDPDLQFGNDHKSIDACTIIHSADFYREYVVIDDGWVPYTQVPYDKIATKFPYMNSEFLSVPLHRGMALDAMDAYDSFISILTNEKSGILSWGAGVDEDDQPLLRSNENVVFEMYLASSRSYKRFRVKSSGPVEDGKLTATPDPAAIVYGLSSLPHFIWVAELFRADEYFPEHGSYRNAFAEIALDATEGGNGDALYRVVLMRYGERMYYRQPSSNDVPFDTYSQRKQDVDKALVEKMRRFASFPHNLRLFSGKPR